MAKARELTFSVHYGMTDVSGVCSILSRSKSNLFLAVTFEKKTHFSFIVIVLELRFTFCAFLSPFHMLVASPSNLSALVLDTTLLFKSGEGIPEGGVTTAHTRLVGKTAAARRPTDSACLSRVWLCGLYCAPSVARFRRSGAQQLRRGYRGRFPAVWLWFSASGVSRILRKILRDHQAVGEEKGITASRSCFPE